MFIHVIIYNLQNFVQMFKTVVWPHRWKIDDIRIQLNPFAKNLLLDWDFLTDLVGNWSVEELAWLQIIGVPST